MEHTGKAVRVGTNQASSFPHPPDASPLIVWLRRYRRYLPIPFVLLVLIGLRPGTLWGSPTWGAIGDIVGVAICALGQWLRLWAWGSNATVGKWGVRDRGPYVLMRHPLYAGNFLILLGLVVVFHNPWAYLVLLGPFAYLYHVITVMEEQRMRRRFGEDYHEYREHEVPRFLPALSNFGQALRTTMPFGWGFAWRKEYESFCGWMAGVMILEAYEGILIRGWEQNWPYTVRWILLLLSVGLLALGSRIYKSRAQ